MERAQNMVSLKLLIEADPKPSLGTDAMKSYKRPPIMRYIHWCGRLPDEA